MCVHTCVCHVCLWLHVCVWCCAFVCTCVVHVSLCVHVCGACICCIVCIYVCVWLCAHTVNVPALTSTLTWPLGKPTSTCKGHGTCQATRPAHSSATSPRGKVICCRWSVSLMEMVKGPGGGQPRVYPGQEISSGCFKISSAFSPKHRFTTIWKSNPQSWWVCFEFLCNWKNEINSLKFDSNLP